MARKKKKKKVVEYRDPESEDTRLLFRAYGVLTKKVNYYHMKLRLDEVEDVVYDWYHTTGSLVRCADRKYFKSIGKYSDPEDIAMLMIKKETNGI